MRRILMILFIGLILLLSNGCGCLRRTVYVEVPVKSDSVFIERLVRDTVTVTIPGDSISVVAVDSSHLENRYSMSDAVVDSTGRLHHSLVNKNIKVEKEIVYKEIEKTVEKEVPVIKEVTKEVKVIPDYYKWINILFWCVVGIGLVFVIFKVKKFFHIP